MSQKVDAGCGQSNPRVNDDTFVDDVIQYLDDAPRGGHALGAHLALLYGDVARNAIDTSPLSFEKA